MWNELLSTIVKKKDCHAARDSQSGILIGAEPRSLGTEDAPLAVLLVHGFVGTPNNFNDLPDRIAHAGHRARVMLLPGHGTTPLDFEKTSSRELEEAVVKELQALRTRHDVVVLLGHSMGGSLATIVAARCGADGLILAAPYFAVTHHWYYGFRPEAWAKLAAPVIRWVPLDQRKQPVNLPESREKILSYNWIPTRSALTAIELAEKARCDDILAKITMPTLIIHSRKDSVTDPTATETVFQRIPTTSKQIVWLDRSDHIIFWDYESDEVAEAVLKFLQGFSDRPGDSKK